MAQILTRYGHAQAVDDPQDPWITEKLIAELRTEEHDEPDDEHTQVAVSNDGWAVTASVSGLVTLESMDFEASPAVEDRHLRDAPDAQLVEIWRAVVRGDDDALLAAPWRSFDDLGPWVDDFYRRPA